MAVTLDLSGRTALITGAGSGIGSACADLVAEAGAHVVAADLNEGAAAATAARIVAGGGLASHERLDVSSWPQCEDLAGRLSVDILINCAATWTLGPFVESDPATWDGDLAVTLTGQMHLARAVVPTMIDRGGGVIINISSDAGRIGEPGQVAYSAAKAGVVGFTKALAREVGRYGIRVNCVAPGLTRTPAAASYIAAMSEKDIRRKYPLGRIGEPIDVANLVVFLASDRSGWITGQVVSISGGYTTAG
jgi:NAD(P)-dependent dehydrogenase (short-subunit alcohol dehydrogenase family)